MGKGFLGYLDAIDYLVSVLEKEKANKTRSDKTKSDEVKSENANED